MYQSKRQITPTQPAQTAKEPTKASRLAIGIVAFVVLMVIAFIILVFVFGWDWTGFTGGESKITITPQGTNTEYFPGKTLWDWAQLLGVLAIPVVVGFGVAWFTRTQQLRDQEHEKLQRERDQQLADQRVKSEQEAAERRAQTEREAEEKRAQTEREIAHDNQQEAALNEYIKGMSVLLLERNLLESDKFAVVRTIARVRTLTLLPRLDGKRKMNVLQFLYESRLIDASHIIGGGKTIIELQGADLTGADLEGTNLNGVDLYKANLKGAILTYAFLISADLSSANLEGAKLIGVCLGGSAGGRSKLIETNLVGADLEGAILEGGADLNGANLWGANLRNAHLTDADLTETPCRLLCKGQGSTSERREKQRT